MNKPTIDLNKCVGCGVCVTNCPAEAIIWDDDDMPTITDDCAECGRCLDWCPAGAIR